MDGYGQIFLGAGVTACFHPLTYVKTLIQVGYEPLPPISTTSIFGRKVLAYPGLFKYLREIRKQDGFFGMYRGLGARMSGGILGTMVTNAVSIHIRGEPIHKNTGPNSEIDGDEETTTDQIMAMVKDTGYETLARCTGVIVSQPFHVIMIRQMAQFVGKETEYSNVFSSMSEIYSKDGILGFFSGIVPRLFGEVITIWLANMLAHLLNNYLLPKSEGATYMKSYTSAVSSLMVTQVTYPFMLVSNIMAINDTSLQAGQLTPTFRTWRACWRYLSHENALKRGSSVFMRYYKGPITFVRDGGMSAARY